MQTIVINGEWVSKFFVNTKLLKGLKKGLEQSKGKPQKYHSVNVLQDHGDHVLRVVMFVTRFVT